MNTPGQGLQVGIAAEYRPRRMRRGRNGISQYEIIPKAGEYFQKIIFTLLKTC
jgi:hypothetical protein